MFHTTHECDCGERSIRIHATMWGPPPRVSDGCGVLCVRLWRPKGEYPKYQYERKALLTLFGPGKNPKKCQKKKGGTSEGTSQLSSLTCLLTRRVRRGGGRTQVATGRSIFFPQNKMCSLPFSFSPLLLPEWTAKPTFFDSRAQSRATAPREQKGTLPHTHFAKGDWGVRAPVS